MDTVYTLRHQLENLNTYFTLCYCLFGSTKLSNVDLYKYKYTSYGIGFDFVQNFYLQIEAMEKMSLFLELT